MSPGTVHLKLQHLPIPMQNVWRSGTWSQRAPVLSLRPRLYLLHGYSHKKEHTCAPKDDIVAYFCFPTIATAVAMRPGDIVIFDPTIPHCISSRRNNSDNIYCISLYLKSLVVGLNNNKLELTPAQSALSSQFTDLTDSHSSKLK